MLTARGEERIPRVRASARSGCTSLCSNALFRLDGFPTAFPTPGLLHDHASQELLDETGILPLLNETACIKEATSLASKVGSLSNTLTAAGTGGGSASASPFPTQNKGSWERGVAVSKYPTEGHRSVEKGLGVGGSGDVEEVDEVDVIMQVRARCTRDPRAGTSRLNASACGWPEADFRERGSGVLTLRELRRSALLRELRRSDSFAKYLLGQRPPSGTD